MDNQRFDTLVRRLTILFSRREGVRVLLAGLGAGVIAATANDAVAHCKGDGKLCRHGGECCSRACLNRKRLKKKNGERTKQKIGKCGCSTSQQQCHVTSDCCDLLLACGDTGCEDHPVCCKPAGAACEDDCDCCGNNVCGEESGRCEAQFCSDTQEPCDFTEECCNDDEICNFVALDCPREPGTGKVCCGTAGSGCEEDCDCCMPFQCDENLEECVAPACLEPGQRRRRGDGARVSAEGLGTLPCPPNDPFLCCLEGDTCCTLGSSPTCCPPGVECTEYGCMPPCPEDHDACGTSELSCGQGPQFQGCKCIRWNGQPFCARLAACFDCQEDADCGHPSALCIPCALCQQQDPAVLSACVFPCVTFLG